MSATGRTLLVLLLALLLVPGCTVDPVGLVVESVEPGKGGARAGVEPGDLLSGWERTDEDGAVVGGGRFDSPFDLRRVEIEHASRGGVVLHVRRGADALALPIPPSSWGLTARPTLPAPAAQRYEDARARARAGDAERTDAAARWTALAEERARRGGDLDAAWLHYRVAVLALSSPPSRSGTDADRALDRAADALERAGAPELIPTMLAEAAERVETRGARPRARALLDRARASLERRGESLELASVLASLGTIHRLHGDLAQSRALFERSVELLERHAPRNYLKGKIMGSLAVTCFVQGDFAMGARVQREAVELLEQVAPVSRAITRLLTDQASLLVRQGDLAAAERLYRRADAIHSEIGSPPARRAAVVANLATVALRRGDLVTAEHAARRALALEEGERAESPRLAPMLGILGQIALARNDPEDALDWSRRALKIQDAAAPDAPLAIALLATAARAADRAGDDRAAGRLLDEATERLARAPVENLDVAIGLRNLARVEMHRGNWASAEARLTEALRIDRNQAPRGPGTSSDLQLLGEVALERGRLGEANDRLRRALDLWRESAPGSWAEARCHHLLGRVRRAEGNPRQALSRFDRAIEILESRPHRPTRDYETLAEEQANARELFDDTLDLLVRLGRTEDAFRVHEQSRARAFRDLLAMRDLDQQETPSDRSVRGRPPSPRTVGEHLQRIDPDAILLSYAVTPEATHLFVLGPGSEELAHHGLPVREDELRDEIVRFHSMLRPGGPESAIRALARRLGTLLLGPAADRIARAERVLVAASGPLHVLPFAALTLPDAPSRYLIEDRSVVSLESIASLGHFERGPRRSRKAAGTIELTAFGDPAHTRPPGECAGELQPPVPEVSALRRLPGTRREVAEISRIWDGPVRTHLGREATEERAVEAGKSADVLHFATHALVDPSQPLDSAIVLTPGPCTSPMASGRDGLLQAWEIFERLRLDAELVTLSGCGTASGRLLAGEGIIGLTRAFRVAGGRSLMASLWEVPDGATARLMADFYRALGAGMAKDRALRRAQLAALHDGERRARRHPSSWAAFQLFGDPAPVAIPR